MFLNINLLLPTMPVLFCWVQNTNLYKHAVKLTFSVVLACINLLPVSAQSVTNGNFNSTTSGWGCSPEATNRESTYGGSSSTNRVAEVD